MRALQVLLLGVVLTFCPASLRAEGEDIVPEGVWRLDARLVHDAYSEAIDRHGDAAAAQSFVALPPPGAGTVSGAISRQATLLALRAQWGLSDTWNLALELSGGQLTQTSSLRAQDAGAALSAQVDSLQSDAFSETGDLVLRSLHRLTYTDRGSLVMWYGLSLPPGPQHSKYIGVPTFALREPGPVVHGGFHYTRFTDVERSRLELDLAVAVPRETVVDTPLQRHRTLVQGNRASAGAGWQQELGPWLLAAALNFALAAANTVDGALLNDNTHAWSTTVSLGHGNLAGLESGPVARPYQVRLELEHTLAGFNTPLRDRLSLALAAYF
ncbi:MAG: hypothetical protein HY342_00030 [Candidatus Lambdaproteobacteria bacterium]|nr:hypothetical protein [Candidatus Lambdaproteobacteria bacterium]